MDLYIIHEKDDFGRKTNISGIFEGLDKNNAREKASIYYNNEDIIKYPGFYSCNIITEQQIQHQKEILLNELNKLNIIK